MGKCGGGTYRIHTYTFISHRGRFTHAYQKRGVSNYLSSTYSGSISIFIQKRCTITKKEALHKNSHLYPYKKYECELAHITQYSGVGSGWRIDEREHKYGPISESGFFELHNT